jgi:hypothetical protein
LIYKTPYSKADTLVVTTTVKREWCVWVLNWLYLQACL